MWIPDEGDVLKAFIDFHQQGLLGLSGGKVAEGENQPAAWESWSQGFFKDSFICTNS